MKYPTKNRYESRFFHKILARKHLNVAQFSRKTGINYGNIKFFYDGTFLPGPSNTQTLVKFLNMNYLNFLEAIHVPLSKTHFGRELKALRYSKGLSQKQVAKQDKTLTDHHIANVELYNCVPTDKTVVKFSHALHVQPMYFYKSVCLDRYGHHKVNPDTYKLMKLEYHYSDYLLKHGNFTKMARITKQITYLKNKISVRRLFKVASMLPVPAVKLFKMFGYSEDYINSLGFKLTELSALNHITLKSIDQKLGISHEMMSLYINNRSKPSQKRLNYINKLFNKYHIKSLVQ